jgi:hypothetical protein
VKEGGVKMRERGRKDERERGRVCVRAREDENE